MRKDKHIKDAEEELLRTDNIELSDVHESKTKKILITLGGIFLILLLLSFVLVTYPVDDIIKGFFESHPLEQGRIELGDFTIFLDGSVQEELKNIYFANQKTEFSLCLKGRRENSNYFITLLYQPIQYAQQFDHVSFEPCDKDTLITLHSHPYKSCIASETDLNTLNKTKQYNKEILMLIMCEPDRFSVYS